MHSGTRDLSDLRFCNTNYVHEYLYTIGIRLRIRRTRCDPQRRHEGLGPSYPGSWV